MHMSNTGKWMLSGLSSALLLVLTLSPLHAAPPYDYFQVNYVDASDGLEDGLGVEISHRFDTNGYTYGAYTSIDNLDRFEVGVGYVRVLDRFRTFDLTVAYEDWSNGADDSALVLGGGIRHHATRQLHLRGGAAFYAFDNADNDLALSGEIAFNVTSNVDVFTNLEYFTDASFRIFGIGGRMRF